MSLIPHPKETSKEAQARQALQGALEPGESLLEYSNVTYHPAIYTGQPYWIGLTDRRFILIRPKKPQRAYSIYFAFLQEAKPLGTGLGSRTLKLTLRTGEDARPGKETFIFASNRSSGPYLSSMLEKYNQRSEPPAPITTQLATQQVKDFQDMGAFNAAQALLRWRMQADPFFGAIPEVQDLQRQMGDLKLGMRVAAVAFALLLVYFVVMAINGLARLGFGTVFAALAIFELLRGRSAARSTALSLALLTAFFNLLLNLVGISPLDIIVWVSFGLAMALLLAGSPNRLRIAAGGLVFLVGVVGVIGFTFLSARFAPSVLNAVLPKSTGPFVDDFSTKRGWAEKDNASVTIAREGGAYSMMVKEADNTYLAAPPITFFPVRGEVDVWAAPGFTDTIGGLFGLGCRWLDAGNNGYVLFINQRSQMALVARIKDGTSEILSNAPLKAGAMKPVGEVNRIGLGCQNNTVSVTVNGAMVVELNDPVMSQLKDGPMVLMVVGTSQLPAGGFKVLFDNASFWPAP